MAKNYDGWAVVKRKKVNFCYHGWTRTHEPEMCKTKEEVNRTYPLNKGESYEKVKLVIVGTAEEEADKVMAARPQRRIPKQKHPMKEG